MCARFVERKRLPIIRRNPAPNVFNQRNKQFSEMNRVVNGTAQEDRRQHWPSFSHEFGQVENQSKQLENAVPGAKLITRHIENQ